VGGGSVPFDSLRGEKKEISGVMEEEGRSSVARWDSEGIPLRGEKGRGTSKNVGSNGGARRKGRRASGEKDGNKK